MLKFSSKIISSFVIYSFFLASNAFSGIKEFNERFVLVKNSQGDVTKIKDTSLTYRRHLKEELWSSYDMLMNRLNEYKDVPNPTDESLEEDFAQISDLTEDQVDYQEKLTKIMARLQKAWGPGESKSLLLEKKEQINPILDKLENDIEQLVSLPEWQVVSSLNQPGYFYKRKVFRTIIRNAASQIKLILPIGPAVYWAIYYVKMYERYLHETKREHQNMLLYYLTNYSGETLGLTELEHKKALSSIFESNIAFYDIFELFRARRTWKNYGLSKLIKIKEKVEKRKEKYEDHFSGSMTDLTTFHSQTTKDDGKVLVDFYTKKSLLSGKYSLSYYYNKPKLVLAKRIYLTMLRFVYDFLPLPTGVGFILDQLTASEMNSQIRREGSLIAHFEDHGDKEMVKKLFIQAVNPVALGFEKAFVLLKQ